MRLKRRKHCGHKPKHNKKSCAERRRIRLEKERKALIELKKKETYSSEEVGVS